ncbi:MAG: hypothetical protein RL885_12545 [Planctomycetota bacterium]
MKFRTITLMTALLAVLGLFANSPARALDDEQELSGSVEKKLTDLIARYYEYKDQSSYLNMEKAMKEIRGALADAAKKWRIDIESEDEALQYINAYVPAMNLFAKYDSKIKSGKLEEGELDDGPKFHIHLPKTYKGRSVRKMEDFIPVIVDIRPAGEDAQAWFEKHWDKQPVLDEAALLLPTPPEDGEWDTDEGLANLLTPLGSLSWDQVAFDQDRMFLCGSGKTAAAAARIAARFSDRFAGCLLRSGGTDQDYYAPNLARIAVFAAEESPLVKAVEAKQGNVTKGKVEGEALEKWVTETKRIRYPEKISGVVSSLAWSDAVWLKVREFSVTPEADKPDTYPQFQASLDREANKIKVDCKGISKFYFRLNDAVLDLKKEIVVEINGQEAFKKKVERNVDEMLDTAWLTGERARLWTRMIEVNVPADTSKPK